MAWCPSMLATFHRSCSNLVWETVSGDESWIYVFHPETRQQWSQGTSVGRAPPHKLRHKGTTANQMVAFFVVKSGHVVTIPRATQPTLTTKCYTSQCVCVLQVLAAVAERGPRTHRSVLLHHDIAVAYRAKLSRDFLSSNEFYN